MAADEDTKSLLTRNTINKTQTHLFAQLHTLQTKIASCQTHRPSIKRQTTICNNPQDPNPNLSIQKGNVFGESCYRGWMRREQVSGVKSDVIHVKCVMTAIVIRIFSDAEGVFSGKCDVLPAETLFHEKFWNERKMFGKFKYQQLAHGFLQLFV